MENASRVKLSRRLGGALRVMGLWSFCLGLGLVFWVQRATAQMSETVQDIGQQMLTWYGSKSDELPRRITINGLEFSLVSATSRTQIHQLFETFAQECSRRSGLSLTDAISHRVRSTANDQERDLLSGVFRQESETQGIVVCLDTGRPLQPSELFERLQRYGSERDLSALGSVRAMVARRSESRTQALLIGSVGQMNLSRAFPALGDAPGIEPVLLPRPPHSRRLLDTAEHSASNAVHVYETSGGSVDAVTTFYKSELPRLGWHATPEKRPGVLMVEQGRRRVLLLSRSSGPETVRTSLVELSR